MKVKAVVTILAFLVAQAAVAAKPDVFQASIVEHMKSLTEAKIDIAKISRDASFEKDLGMDDFDLAELVMDLEHEFSITIPEEDQAKFKKVGDLVAYLDTAKATKIK